MKKKNYIHLAIIAIILFILFIVVGKTTHCEGISTYKDTYIITGDKANQTKFQVSFRYGLWEPFDSGLYFGYTLLAHWNIYDKSSPFKELNHAPCLLWEKENLWIFDYLRILPWSHLSNGEDGEDNRSLESGIIQFQVSYNKIINVGINETYTHYYKLANQNADYRRYKGSFATELFLQLKGNRKIFDQEKLGISFEWTTKSYWYQIEFMTRILTPKIRPKLYVQYYRGTGEFLLDYNKFTSSWRIGLIFNPVQNYNNDLEEII